ncbi:hypothetical protein MKW92_052707 [Papaver armeniacum]|nr:hypothetical protein MKW92_052707 [Papaver armeniacum]
MSSDILKQKNVDNSIVWFGSKAKNALAFVTLSADGKCEFMFSCNPSADMLLCESELNEELLKKASVFCYGSVSLFEEPCRSTKLSAMMIVKKAGCILSYDPNLRLGLLPSPQAAKKEIMSIWDQADVVKVLGVQLLQ